MARVSLEKDRELAQMDLLRVSVVADLLGVAPKTVNIWLKDTEFHKIRGVKYLNWSIVRKVREQDVTMLQLPVGSNAAHTLWEHKGGKISTVVPPTGTTEGLLHAHLALIKAKSLLGSQQTIYENVVEYNTQPEIEISQTAPVSVVEKTLEVPPEPEEPMLDIPEEYVNLLEKVNPMNLVVDACPKCPHSVKDFHGKIGCSFAKGTVAECKCKVSV